MQLIQVDWLMKHGYFGPKFEWKYESIFIQHDAGKDQPKTDTCTVQ